MANRAASAPALSVVLPTRNEMALGYLLRILARVSAVPGVELICVDSASSDGTVEAIQAAGARHIDLPDSTRAARLNAGIAAARADRVLLHHPRSLIALGGLEALRDLSSDVVWGGFTQAFDAEHPALAWTSYYSNKIRMDRSGVVYLDHCIFMNRTAIEPPWLRDIEIFEDTALSHRLRKIARPVRLPAVARTSAVRYAHNGAVRQMVMNQVLKVGYAARVPDRMMNAIYERGLGLNNSVTDQVSPANQASPRRRSKKDNT